VGDWKPGGSYRNERHHPGPTDPTAQAEGLLAKPGAPHSDTDQGRGAAQPKKAGVHVPAHPYEEERVALQEHWHAGYKRYVVPSPCPHNPSLV